MREQHGAARGLRRVRGEDELDRSSRRVDVLVAQRLERAVEGLPQRGAAVRVLAAAAQAVVLLGEVCKLEVEPERAQHEHLLVRARECLDLDRLLVARRSRGVPRPLDELQEPFALLLDEHVAEDRAEKADVAPQGRGGV